MQSEPEIQDKNDAIWISCRCKSQILSKHAKRSHKKLTLQGKFLITRVFKCRRQSS
jgi:hypothetical protein